MKFIHTADIHLGAAPDAGYAWGEARKQEIWNSFRRLLDRAEAEQVDLLLIAGDLFHRQPLLRELKEINYLFSKLTRTKVVIIAGNHDYLKRDSYYLGFPWEENVTFIRSGECEKIVFPEMNACVYGLSYESREIREPLYDDLQPEEEDCFNILLAHGGDEKHIPLDKRRLQSAGFDYIALGHIHRPGVLVERKAHYCGALEPLDKNDIGAHGFISGTYENENLSLCFIPWAVREYIPLAITVDERETDYSLQEKIQREITDRGSENIYKITIKGYRDADIIFRTEQYTDCGNVIDIIDESNPAYDFDKLVRLHQEDIVGQYIAKLYHPEMTKTEEKALYYGIQALLEAK